MGSPRVTVCQVTMVSLASSLTVALLISALSASPVALPESSVKSVVTIFKQLAEVVKNTGDVITKIARNKTENQNILQAGEFLSGQGSYGADELPKDLSDLVQDNFQMLVEAIPAIKGNITNILDKIPAVKEMIVDRVQSIPPSPPPQWPGLSPQSRRISSLSLTVCLTTTMLTQWRITLENRLT